MSMSRKEISQMTTEEQLDYFINILGFSEEEAKAALNNNWSGKQHTPEEVRNAIVSERDDQSRITDERLKNEKNEEQERKSRK